MELKAGRKYTLNIVVSNEGIAVAAPVITGWTEEPVLEGDAESMGHLPVGTLLDGEAVSQGWDKVIVGDGQDMVLVAEKNDKIYVNVRPGNQEGIIIEFGTDGMPERVITAHDGTSRDLAIFIKVKPVGSTEEKLGIGIVTEERQIALLEPGTIPEVVENGTLGEKIQYVVEKMTEAVEENGLTQLLPPAEIGHGSQLVNILPMVDLESLPSFTENGGEVLKRAGMDTAEDMLQVVESAGELLTGTDGTESSNAFEQAEQEYDMELGLIRDASLYGFGDVKVTLKWDCSGDVDLHVQDPDGHHIYFSSKNPSGCDGYLDKDNTSGYGPENIFFAKDKAPAGTYKVKLNNYNGRISSAGYTLFIYAKGRTKTYSGTVTSESPMAYFEFDLNGNFQDNTTAWQL